MITCTRCDGSGFLNINQIDDEILIEAKNSPDFCDFVLKWMKSHKALGHDVQVCDCCGDGDSWHGVPGEHYNEWDPRGFLGPYNYNGGLCECN